MKTALKFLFHFILFGLLTILTQIGGFVYLASLFIAKKIKKKVWYKTSGVFILTYTVFTFLFVPFFASLNGRQRVISNANVEAVNLLTVWLNRNYVAVDMNKCISEISLELNKLNPDIKLRYLDACFPFFDGFPLLPHLSHNDGKKIDFSLVYEDESGKIINKSKSNSGYGVFEDPKTNEYNQANVCLKQGYFKYDFPKYLTLGQKNADLHFSEKGTSDLMQVILLNKGIEKVFIEPHLKSRLGIIDSRVRFQGCKSVRHDDHIHIQIK
nr:hypothetical protein [uncultured Carboxylicivirga sp.]